MRSAFTTLALTVAVVALSAGESSAQWRGYNGGRVYGSNYNYGYQTYSPYSGLNSAYFGFASRSYSNNYPSYGYTPYSYPTYNYSTYRNAGFSQNYYRRYR